MKYRVFWSPQAEKDLERIIKNESRMKLLLGDTVRSMNETLVSKPMGIGESRPDGTRIGFFEQLAFYYEVMDDVRTVVVHGIWKIAQR